MTPQEFRRIREELGLTREELAEEMGLVGSERNNSHRIQKYENSTTEIPLYMARLLYMIHEHWLAEDNHLPEWPDWPVPAPQLTVKRQHQGARYANSQRNRRQNKVVSA